MFAGALIKKWWTLMSCAVFTFVGLYSLVFHKSNLWVVGASIVAGVALFFWAAFLVWNDEHQARIQELLRVQQPDVGLVWDWPENERSAKQPMGYSEKSILVQNRSDGYIYNIQIEPIHLKQELVFDLINEIAPQQQHVSRGRWDGKSTDQTHYIYFFSANEKEIVDKKWMYEKVHNRGFSDKFSRIPMALTYESAGMKWRAEFDFNYDPGDESCFVKKSSSKV